jgi:hypothetical protein
MPHEYSAENHDWDLTLRAAWSLLIAGQVPDQVQVPYSPNEKKFGCFTGSMLLSFCAIESFSASIAFSMPRESRFKDFDFSIYRQKRVFWEKIDMIFTAIPHPVDKSRGLFQAIGRMQDWRNLVTHSSPYEIAKTEIANTTGAPTKLHAPFRHKEYSRRVTLDDAKEFYATALAYVDLLRRLTGIDPRASATYVIGE